MAVSTIKSGNYFRTAESPEAVSITLAGGEVGSVTVTPPTISGYTPIGIVGVRKNGGNNNFVSISAFYINASNQGYVGVANTSSSSKTVGVFVTFLYQKN